MTPPEVTLPIAAGTGTPVASAGVAVVVACTCAPAIGLFVTLLMTEPSMEPLTVCRTRSAETMIEGIGIITSVEFDRDSKYSYTPFPDALLSIAGTTTTRGFVQAF